MADLKIYHYDPKTGELLGQGEADADPLDKGNWLIPAHATSIELPKPAKGKVTRFDGDKWVQDGSVIVVDPEPGSKPETVDPLAKLVDFLKANPDVLELVTKGIQSEGKAK